MIDKMEATMRALTPADRKRFLSKCSEEHSGCVTWNGTVQPSGHGSFRVGNTMQRAHRIAYALHKPLTSTDVVRHSCDNPGCVNPEHLIKGTQADNIADKLTRGRQPTGEEVHNAKLSYDQAFIILTSFRGIYHKDVGKMFNVSGSLVSRIRRGVAWSHMHRRVLPL